MLSPRQHEEFAAAGITYLPGAVGVDRVQRLRSRILDHLSERGLDPASAHAPPVTPSQLRGIMRTEPFGRLWSASVRSALDELLGAGRWHEPGHGGQVLMITSPNPNGAWAVPHQSWHLDYQAPGNGTAIPGVQLFLMLDHVSEEGGATMVVAGSHRLVDRLRCEAGSEFEGRSADLRKGLRANVPWLDALCSVRPDEDRATRFMRKSEDADGVELQVAPLCGEPGDVVLMHPWTLHAASLNCSHRPRLVLTERIRRSSPVPS